MNNEPYHNLGVKLDEILLLIFLSIFLGLGLLFVVFVLFPGILGM